MARKIYDPKVKAAFMQAARDARASGKTWQEAFGEAKKAGYTGTLGGLGQMFIVAAGKKGKPKGKPGRKPGAKVGRPKGSVAAAAGVGSLQAAIDRIVQERVSAALSKAIAALQAAK